MAKNSNIVEVVFKGERRAIYRDRNEIDIKEGEYVIVEAERGQDMGAASLIGALVRLKRGKGETRSIIRKAMPADLEVLGEEQGKGKRAPSRSARRKSRSTGST